MPELHNVQQMLEEAKRAADAGDLASADALLRDAARIQEAELGPLHPELANTVNNLAIVAEMDGRGHDAETYYRRAVAITSASLPPDDPIVASSRKNLEDFCRERGLPVDLPPPAPAIQHVEHRTEEVVGDQTVGKVNTPAGLKLTAADAIAQTSSRPAEPPSVADPTESSDRLPAAVTPPKRSIAIVVIGFVALVVAVLFVTRPWSARESPPPTQTVEPAAPPAAEPSPARPSVAVPAPSEPPKTSAVAPSGDKSRAAASSPPTPGRDSGDMSLATSQLCRTFSVGRNWRCDPAGESVEPGALVLYTRVKSPRDAVVIHQWYRGDTLRKSARLPILANSTDGYRTYSRQTVNSGENWRVEVRNTAGALLYEQRVSVR